MCGSRDVIEASSVLRTRSASAAARNGVHLLRKASALERSARLIAGASSDRGGEHGDRKQHKKREPFMRLSDIEGMKRPDEKEVVGQGG